jgi:hypothetical protein
VATTEVGYLGFARQDLRILDLRGLTSRAIAQAAPPSAKRVGGIYEANWFLPTSSTGRVLLRDKPAIIATFDSPPRLSVLGGAYRFDEGVGHRDHPSFVLRAVPWPIELRPVISL